MLGGHKNTFDCIKAFSETDFTEDLKKFDVPTLIIHGEDDQIVPIGASALAAAKIVTHAILKVYPMTLGLAFRLRGVRNSVGRPAIGTV